MLVVVSIDYALSHVFLKCGCNAEWHVAESALVDVLAHSAMRLHVPGELGALRTCVVAEFTFVRFLPGMRSSMDRQVGAILEYFAAELTCVISISACDLFPGLWVEQSVQTTFLCDGLQCTWFHRR